MAYGKQHEDAFLEALRETGSKGAACAQVGVSRQFYLNRVKQDEDFAAAIDAALLAFPAQVLHNFSDGLLHGFKYEVLDRAGNVRTLRKEHPKVMMEFLERVFQFKEQNADQSKSISFEGADGEELDMTALLRAGVERAREIQIESPRVVDIEDDPGPYEEETDE